MNDQALNLSQGISIFRVKDFKFKQSIQSPKKLTKETKSYLDLKLKTLINHFQNNQLEIPSNIYLTKEHDLIKINEQLIQWSFVYGTILNHRKRDEN